MNNKKINIENDNYFKYKKILNKYFKEDEIGVWVSGFLIMNYIFEYGNNIDKFEEYIKKYRKLKKEMESKENE